MRAIRGEAGSGTVLVVGLMACLVAVTALLMSLSLLLVAKQRLEAAADAAALAAADTLSGAVAGYPCEAAEAAAKLNRASLARCELAGPVASVTATAHYLGLELAIRARAGPPGTP